MISKEDSMFVYHWMIQLLQDASDQRLEVHFGDALNFKIEQACGPYATRTNWEDGENSASKGFQNNVFFKHVQLQISMW